MSPAVVDLPKALDLEAGVRIDGCDAGRLIQQCGSEGLEDLVHRGGEERPPLPDERWVPLDRANRWIFGHEVTRQVARVGSQQVGESSRLANGPRSGSRKPGVTWAFMLERVTRIELAYSAWEADVLPLNYTRGSADCTEVPVSVATVAADDTKAPRYNRRAANVARSWVVESSVRPWRKVGSATEYTPK